MDDVDERGEPITDDTLFVLLNADPGSVDFVLPPAHPGIGWEVVVDTAGMGIPEPPRLDEGTRVALVGRSLQVLRARKA